MKYMLIAGAKTEIPAGQAKRWERIPLIIQNMGG